MIEYFDGYPVGAVHRHTRGIRGSDGPPVKGLCNIPNCTWSHRDYFVARLWLGSLWDIGSSLEIEVQDGTIYKVTHHHNPDWQVLTELYSKSWLPNREVCRDWMLINAHAFRSDGPLEVERQLRKFEKLRGRTV